MLWFKKKMPEESMFMIIMELFFIKDMSLSQIKYFIKIKDLKGDQLSEAKQALRAIVLSSDPGRDTMLLADCVEKLDRALEDRQALREELLYLKGVCNRQGRFVFNVQRSLELLKS